MFPAGYVNESGLRQKLVTSYRLPVSGDAQLAVATADLLRPATGNWQPVTVLVFPQKREQDDCQGDH